ncbi:MAG: hypothetical protein LAT68_15480 [Cyclobacteriaceae bacterium]|nr:hypothetical protein [Cyclobacteriaceae bacterium]MCH8517723.1 hypothetical protein [Cyclobacteriaceae bacterium]
MDLIFDLYRKLAYVLVFIPIGWYIDRKGWLNANWISKIVIFLLIPALVFKHVLGAEKSLLLFLPIITFIFSALMNIPAKLISKKSSSTVDKAFLTGSFTYYNITFFGIPVVLSLFSSSYISALICIYLGSAFYANTVGFYQLCKTQIEKKAAIFKVLQIPFFYIFVAALVCRYYELSLGDQVAEAFEVIEWSSAILGMLLLGMNVSHLKIKSTNWMAYIKILGFRVVFGVIIMAGFLTLDYFYFNALPQTVFELMMLIPLFPVATKITIFASFLNVKEEESALYVLISMALSVMLIPAAALLFRHFFG